MRTTNWLGGFAGIFVALVCAGASYGQATPSRGETLTKHFTASVASADQLRQQTVVQDVTVNNGFGVAPVQAPAAAPAAAAPTPRPAFRGVASYNPSPSANPFSGNAAGPARRQSASFGVGAGGPIAKPFADVSASPTVSPYLNLFRDDFSGESDLNYQTLVRPQLQQRAFNQQIDRQAQQLNQRLTAIAAQNAYNTQGSEGMMPTGHAAAFQYHSRFYPSKRRPAARR